MIDKAFTSARLGDQLQSDVSSGDEAAKGSSDFVESRQQRNVWNLHDHNDCQLQCSQDSSSFLGFLPQPKLIMGSSEKLPLVLFGIRDMELGRLCVEGGVGR